MQARASPPSALADVQLQRPEAALGILVGSTRPEQRRAEHRVGPGRERSEQVEEEGLLAMRAIVVGQCAPAIAGRGAQQGSFFAHQARSADAVGREPLEGGEQLAVADRPRALVQIHQRLERLLVRKLRRGSLRLEAVVHGIVALPNARVAQDPIVDRAVRSAKLPQGRIPVFGGDDARGADAVDQLVQVHERERQRGFAHVAMTHAGPPREIPAQLLVGHAAVRGKVMAKLAFVGEVVLVGGCELGLADERLAGGHEVGVEPALHLAQLPERLGQLHPGPTVFADAAGPAPGRGGDALVGGGGTCDAVRDGFVSGAAARAIRHQLGAGAQDGLVAIDLHVGKAVAARTLVFEDAADKPLRIAHVDRLLHRIPKPAPCDHYTANIFSRKHPFAETSVRFMMIAEDAGGSGLKSVRPVPGRRRDAKAYGTLWANG